MFKLITLQEQVLNAQSEIARLKATVGEFPQQEEGAEQPKLVDRMGTAEASIDDVVAILAEIEGVSI